MKYGDFMLKDKDDWCKPPVVEQFLAICSVPRYSGHNERIGAYIMDFAFSHGLEAHMDDVGNIIVIHPGTYDTKIILQCHQDMVPAVDDGITHDFTKDPIEYRIDGNVITANGTSLGADDGTGIAMCLCALKDPSLKDRGFRCIFTVDEETIMKGAKYLDPSWLNGSAYLINIDDEMGNEIVVGSAGSANVVSESELPMSDTRNCYEICISGLTGGHSGSDVEKGRANAIRLVAGFLDNVEGLRISSISGGSAFNAIPTSCAAVFSCSEDYDIDSAFRQFCDSSKEEFDTTDPNMDTSLLVSGIHHVSDTERSKSLIKCILDSPFGVLKRTSEGVITSSNTGIISTENGIVKISFMIRSAEDTELDRYADITCGTFIDSGFSASAVSRLSGWMEDGSTALIDKTKSVMTDTFGYPADVRVIHAGLECGEIKNKCPYILAVSIGPTVLNPHSTSECTYIDSIIQTWDAVHRVISDGVN